MGKVVVVTGASRGVGEVTARLFASRGWKVAAGVRSSEALGDGMGVEGIVPVRLDVTDEVSVRAAVEEVQRRLGPIDVLVNNAGIGLGGAVEDIGRDDWMRLLDVNVLGVAATMRAVLPLMRERRSGVVVNVSSAAGRIPLPFLAPYCASKYALEGLSEAMRYELAPFGIRIRLVEPGGIRTGFTQEWIQSAAYDPWGATVHRRMQAGSARSQGPEGVAETIFRAATDASTRLRYAANGAGPMMLLHRWLPDRLWRALMQRAFSLSP